MGLENYDFKPSESVEMKYGKYMFHTDDEMEAKRFIKATDMASFMFELQHNTKDVSHEKISELAERFGINIDDLIE